LLIVSPICSAKVKNRLAAERVFGSGPILSGDDMKPAPPKLGMPAVPVVPGVFTPARSGLSAGVTNGMSRLPHHHAVQARLARAVMPARRPPTVPAPMLRAQLLQLKRSVIQLVSVAVAPTNAEIRFSADRTRHGDSDAEIKAHIIANWATKVLKTGPNLYRMPWGERASNGVIFFLNAHSITVTHAQSAADMAAQAALREQANAARAAAGGGTASASWRV
jgi:hypothetical protein